MFEQDRLVGSETELNLKKAFAGESQANRRYIFSAKYISEHTEGILQADMIKLFRETAYAETYHAHRHFTLLTRDPVTNKPKGSVIEHIISAILGESEEYRNMYPSMAKKAREEGFALIADWFETLAKVERKHANQFREAFKLYVKNASIVIYSARTCTFCTYAKDLLKKIDCQYKEIDLTDKPHERDTLTAQTGSKTVPQIFVNGTYIGGYTDLEDYTGLYLPKDIDYDIPDDLLSREEEMTV